MSEATKLNDVNLLILLQFAFITGVYLVGPSVSSALQVWWSRTIMIWCVVIFTFTCSMSAPHCCLDGYCLHNVLHREGTLTYHGEQMVMKPFAKSLLFLLHSFIPGPSLVEFLVR